MYDIEGTERRDDWKYNSTHRNDHTYIYDDVGIYQQKEKKGKTHISEGKEWR